MDLAELARKDMFAQVVYDNNFRAPTPPDRSVFLNITQLNNDTLTKITPLHLNNGAIIQWDSTAEMSVDIDEQDLILWVIFCTEHVDLTLTDTQKY